jgi:hypothetical protein
LFHFDGPNGGTSLVDSSGKGKIATIHGNPAISTARAKFGGASLFIAGDTNAQTNYVTVGGGSDFYLPGDFTIDWWLYVVAYTDVWGGIVQLATTFTMSGPVVGLGWDTGGVGFHFDGTNAYPSSRVLAPTTGSWHHIAITRAGGTYRGFIDGGLVYSQAEANDILGGQYAWLTGLSPDAENGDLNCYIDELRIVNGSAVWVTGFTPPTSAY